MPVQSSALSFLGIAKETTYGTSVAPTHYIPVTSMKPSDKIEFLEDKGIRGSMVDVYDLIAGPKWCEYEFEGEVFGDTIGWMLTGILGDLVTTGTSPLTHNIALLNSGVNLPSYTISDFYGQATRRWPGFIFSELTLKSNADGLLSYSAKGMGQSSATASKPTASFTAVKPFAGVVGGPITFDTFPYYALEFELSIKRNLTPLHAIDGTQGPRTMWAGPLTVEGKAKFIAEDDVLYGLLAAGSVHELDITYGASPLQVKFWGASTRFTVMDIDRGADFVALDTSFRCLPNSVNAGASGGLSPIKATLINAIAANVYK